MSRSFKRGFIAAALAVGLVCAATPARADLTITVQEDNGPIATIVNVSGNPTTDLTGAGNATTADYSVKINSGESNQTGTQAELLSAVLSITNTSGASGHILHIVITGTGYSSPTTPPAVVGSSHIGGTVPANSSTKNTLAFQSYVDSTGFGPQNPNINVQPNGSFSSDTTALFNTLSAPFSIKETIDLNLNSLNDQINYSSSTTLNPVPEPASIVSACTAILGLVGAHFWRRRMSSAVC